MSIIACSAGEIPCWVALLNECWIPLTTPLGMEFNPVCLVVKCTFDYPCHRTCAAGTGMGRKNHLSDFFSPAGTVYGLIGQYPPSFRRIPPEKKRRLSNILTSSDQGLLAHKIRLHIDISGVGNAG